MFFRPDYDELPEAYQPELAYGARTALDRLSVKLSTRVFVFIVMQNGGSNPMMHPQ